jgi:hypothetical protein
MPTDLLSIGSMGANWTQRRSQSGDQGFFRAKLNDQFHWRLYYFGRRTFCFRNNFFLLFMIFNMEEFVSKMVFFVVYVFLHIFFAIFHFRK